VTTPPAGSGLLGAPTGAASTTTNPNGNGGGGGGGSNTPTYPKDAKDYGLAVIAAWMGQQWDRLQTLTSPAGFSQIKDSVTAQGLPDPNWTFISCAPNPDASATSTICIYRNDHGDETDIAMDNASLGHPLAAQQIPLDRTTYPSDPGSYVNTMMSALINGNKQRVVRLANSTVQSKLTCVISSQTETVTPNGSNSTVLVAGLGGDLGKSFTFTVLTQPGGKAHAISAVNSVTC
jgi:hypothetical protein